MNTIELKDRIATVTLSEAEVKTLSIMAQYWIRDADFSSGFTDDPFPHVSTHLDNSFPGKQAG